MKRSRGLIFCTLLLVIVAVPAMAERPIDRVPAGVDYWQTLSSGATAYDFSTNPIPAGFFCAGSAPFKGRVNFEGVPLHTEPAGILGTTDTIIERLSDAVFDDNGTARTLIRGRALNLRATDTLKTSCGRFKVTANLTDNQPTSPMVFHSEHKYGGTFDAQLRLRVRVNFTNVNTKKTFAIVRDVYLPTINNTPFAIGKTAQQACASTAEPIQPASIRLDDGRPVFSHARPEGAGAKLTGSTTATGTTTEPAEPLEPTPVATGCQCNRLGQCAPIYSWHNPCAGETYEQCEQHFTHTPCELGYTSQCISTAVQQGYLDQLKVLYDRGYITEKPETVLRKQIRSVDAIQRDQAARDRKSPRQQ
ncbi:MAG TPA: hypothetical protein VLB76_01375 [Thermoanaerobaculia bacterium]|nr:hypothetical protein [Thermoanaerobaculia bacterium]